MRKKLLSVLLCTAMAATMLTGCGGSDTKKDSSKEAKKVTVSDGGKVLNIRVWNEEFKSRMTDHYPGYEKVSDTEGKIGDVTVKWTITPSDDNAYQNALDEALKKQDSAAADDKIDLFLVEADYALKYVDTNYTLDVVNDLGVSKDALANQYKYTQDIVTDSKGALKGASWQACPAGMIYRRDIAKKVFKTDDPEKIQELFKDWDSFKAASKKLKDAGYLTTASVNDTYRVFSNNVTSKWVENKKINVDENIKAWVDMSKEMVDNGETTTHELWGSDWSEGFMKSSNVFAYFGPAWFIDFSMSADQDGSVGKDGGWAATEGPQGFYWGGTWITAATGTDNPTLVADIMRTMTTNVDVMKEIVTADNDFVNNKPAMEEMAKDENYGDAVLGGQNPLAMFCAGADKIDLSNMSIYDQGCNEEFQNAMKNYFEGNASYDEALDLFYKAVVEKYPELSY
jgi:hypothetical protein